MMKNVPTPQRRSAGVGAAAVALACASAGADGAAAPADGSAAFFDSWLQATARAGGEAIADPMVLPFLFQGRQLQRAAFIAQAVPALFTPAVRRCMQRAVPRSEGGKQVLTCAPYGFVFAPTPAGWRLLEFIADTPIVPATRLWPNVARMQRHHGCRGLGAVPKWAADTATNETK